MLKQRNEQIQAAARGLDLFVCVIAFFAAYHLKPGAIDPIESLTWFLGASIVLHLVIYPLNRFYESLRLKSITDIVLMVIRAGIMEFFILGTLVFIVQAKTTSRYFFGLFLLINYALVLVEKLGVRILLTVIRKRGYNYRQLLVVGSGPNADHVIRSLKRNNHWGYVPIGILSFSDKDSESLHGVPVLGRVSELESIVRGRTVDEVVFALDRFNSEELTEPMFLCERLGISTRVSLAFFDLTRQKIAFTQMEEIPLLTFYTTLRTPTEEFIKRVMDICVSVIGLMITLVLTPWIYFKIQRESPGPILFKQPRVGENGRSFKCYKFRTMSLDAEARKQELADKNQMEGPLFKIENDPRVYPFGAFMRRTSIDELPQFFNILRGDMSVVGTRPPTPDEVKKYETHFRKRLSIRPGLTGLWQVSGRNEIRNFEDVLKIDVEYIERWSIGLDIRIIFKTIWVILFRRGAY